MKKFPKEEVVITPTGVPGLEYAFPKVVGTSFVSEMHYRHYSFSKKRMAIIKEYFNAFADEVALSIDIDMRKRIIEEIKNGEIFIRISSLEKSLRVRHVANKFDENAISVCVLERKLSDNFFDVGFLPAPFSKKVMKEYACFFPIGVVPDYLGMRIHLLLSETSSFGLSLVGEKFGDISMNSIKREKTALEKSSFSSLRKARAILEI